MSTLLEPLMGRKCLECRMKIVRPISPTEKGTFNSSYVNGSVEMECPPWYYRDPDRYDSCKAGKDFSSVLLFQIRTQQLYLQTLYCMTTSNGEGNGRTDVVGSCLLSFDNRLQSSFYPLPCNI